MNRWASLERTAVLQDVDAFTSIPGPLCSSTRAEIVARRFLLRPLPPSSSIGSDINYFQTWYFIRDLYMAPLASPTLDADNLLIPSPGSQGTSWLELFVLFELMGGKLVDNNHVDTPSLSKAVAAKTLLVDLLFFKKICMFIVDTCIGGGERCFFSPSKSQWCRLKTVTFSNFVACINSTIVIPEIYQQRMLHALLCCKQAMPPSKCMAVNRSALLLPLTRFSGKKPPAWRKYSKCDSFIPQEIPPDPLLQGGFFVTSIPDDFSLTCVFCSATKQVRHITLYKSGKWNTLTCTACATSKSSRQWHCACGTPWIGCAVHSASGFLCLSSTRTAPKRKLNYLIPTENYTSNSRNDIATLGSANQGVFKRKRTPRKQDTITLLKRAPSGSSVNPPAQFSKRVRFTGGSSMHQPTKRAPHLLCADAVASVKRLRSAEPLPLSAFLPSCFRVDIQQCSGCDFSFVQPEHMQTDAAGFSSTAASSQSIVQNDSSLSCTSVHQSSDPDFSSSTAVHKSSDHDLSFIQHQHMQTDVAGFSNTAAPSQSIVQTFSNATSVLQSSDSDFSFVQPEHTQTDAAGFSSTAASSQSIVQTVSSLACARRQSSSGTIPSDIYDG